MHNNLAHFHTLSYNCNCNWIQEQGEGGGLQRRQRQRWHRNRARTSSLMSWFLLVEDCVWGRRERLEGGFWSLISICVCLTARKKVTARHTHTPTRKHTGMHTHTQAQSFIYTAKCSNGRLLLLLLCYWCCFAADLSHFTITFLVPFPLSQLFDYNL